MSSFTSALLVEVTEAEKRGRGLVELKAPLGFDYHVGSLGSDDVITVPAGYISDLISVPAILRVFISPLSSGAKAAVIHDWLYDQHLAEKKAGKTPSRTRASIDSIFLEALRVEGVCEPKAIAMYDSVRLQAWTTHDA